MRASAAFALLAAVGVGEALDHAWTENAFTTNWSAVSFSPAASFFGVPYWAFGIIWFPLVLIVGLWSTRLCRAPLSGKLLILLSVGNAFTAYLWFLDLVLVGSFTAAYVGLYVTNYALTGLVVYQNWQSRMMRDFTGGTIIGIVVGVFFGALGAVLIGILGGFLGAIGGYTAKE